MRGWSGRNVITLVFIGFGVLFLAIGLTFTWVTASFVADAKRARGMVVELDWRTDHSSSSYRKHQNDDKPMAYPVVTFTPAGGPERTFRSTSGSNPPSYDRGEWVEVLYRADSPQDAKIDGFASLWLGPVIFSAFGLVFSGIGTGLAMSMRRR
ncbi:DUF3592 domain-containing protein [Streptomyces antnestii]|uniref:DUF3592 domain-containing protein n=1 Tax=Streptomyces antnestii TaxID=2494256 RepID=A0A437Q0H0_9ACTN|nr:DUF3592 domain-containing protein [Streptomyces sp. San01]